MTAAPQRGPGLARAEGELDSRLGRVLIEVGHLADASEADAELFRHLASAVHALGLAQRLVRRRRSP